MTTLATIREKIRKVTARPSPNQITDDEIDEYINTFYLYDLPETLRLWNLKDNYYFTTNANISQYDFDRQNYTNISQPAYCDGYEMVFLQDEAQFFRMWPKLQSKTQIATGDGGAGPYAFTITSVPFLRSDNTPIGSKGTTVNVTVSGPSAASATENAYDDGVGGWLNAAAGNIDYVTGVGTITFNNPILAGEPIYAHVHPYSASRPTTILFFQDKFTLRPVPDAGYLVQLEAYRTPTQLLLDTDNPELFEWWQLLAFGGALKIFIDNGDFDQYQIFRPFYEEQLLLAQRRTLKQYSNQRAATIYAPPNTAGPYANYWPGY